MMSVKAGAAGKKLPPHMQRDKEVAERRKAQLKSMDDEDDGVVVRKKRQSKSEREVQEVELPNWIKLKSDDGLHGVPRHVLTGQHFKWDPQAFTLESERLKDKLIESTLQDDSLKRWIDDPTLPVVYGVAGSPDDVQARYFAAYLAQIHVRRLGAANSRVVWHSIYGGYKNDLLEDYRNAESQYEPTLLVLTNLPSNATAQKLEKARDLIERFSTIPRIVVNAGEDPMSFLLTKLNVQCNGMAYFSADIMRRKVEVI
jgi:hypothetical protein